MLTEHHTTLVRPRCEGSNQRNMDVIDQLLTTTTGILFRTGKELIAWAILAFQRVGRRMKLAALPVPAHSASEIENRVPATSVDPSATHRRRAFILSVVQPGLAGLMDGSISSLAPLFAAAFATRNSTTAFLVGLATAVGAGV